MKTLITCLVLAGMCLGTAVEVQAGPFRRIASRIAARRSSGGGIRFLPRNRGCGSAMPACSGPACSGPACKVSQNSEPALPAERVTHAVWTPLPSGV